MLEKENRKKKECKLITDRGCMDDDECFASYICQHHGMSMHEDELHRKQMHGQDAAEVIKH